MENAKIDHIVRRIWDVIKKEELSDFEAVEQIACLLLIWEGFLGFRSERYGWEEVLSQHPGIYQEKVRSILDSWRDRFRFYGLHPELKVSSPALSFMLKSFMDLYREMDSDRKELDRTGFLPAGFILNLFLHKINWSYTKNEVWLPRHIIKLMVALADPQKKDRILDPACGTGGFLLTAGEHVVARQHSGGIDEDGFPYPDIDGNVRYDFLSSSQGIERSEKLYCLAVYNLLLNGVKTPLISKDDFLARMPLEKFDLVLANPPFGLKVDFRRHDSRFNTHYSDVLFIEQISENLMTGEGRAVVIMPENFLTNQSNSYVACREYLIREHTLEAVVSLPSGIFRPHTNGKSAILIFRRQSIEQPYPVWFADLQSDGYSLDSNRRRMQGNPLPEMVKMFQERNPSREKDEDDTSFFVSSEEIERNKWQLSYTLYRTEPYIKQHLRPPGQLMDEILRLEQEIVEDLQKLRNIAPWIESN